MTRKHTRFTQAASLLAAALLLGAVGCDYGTDEVAQADREMTGDEGIGGVEGGGDEGIGVTGEADEAADFEGEVMAGQEQASEQIQDARELVRQAVVVVEQMSQDPQLAQQMQQAQGIFIVPEYGKAAALVGARGGEGVLLGREGDQWSDPVFYDIGAISVGPQLGATGGAIAMLLMSEQSVNAFKGDNNFSLNADAGFTIVDYSARAQGSVGKGGDVILWSDTEGAFAGVSLSATDISWDDEENAAFYDQMATADDVLSGRVTSQEGDALQRALL